MSATADIKELELTYCKAANALSDYRREHGFEPGAQVVAQYRDDPAKNGVIAPYGRAWATTDAMTVPVLLDSGVLQPWNMSDLTLVVVETADTK